MDINPDIIRGGATPLTGFQAQFHRPATIVTPGRSSVATFAIGIGTSVASGIVNAAIQAAIRETSYHTNQVFSNVVPDVSSILAAYYGRKIDEATARSLLGYQGVDWQFARPEGEGTNTVRAWKAIVDLGRPHLDLSQYTDLWLQKELNDNDFADKLRRMGLDEGDAALVFTQTGIPDINTAVSWRNRNLITNDQLDYIARKHGITDPAYVRAVRAGYQYLGTATTRNLFYLGTWGRDTAIAQLQITGWGSREDAERILDMADPLTPGEAARMYWRGKLTHDVTLNHIKASRTANGIDANDYYESIRPLPGPGDLVSFAVREVWDDATVQRWGYDQEFPPQLQYFLEQQGMDWGEGFTTPLGQVVPQVNWPQAYWRAHWQPFPVHQAHISYHTLRPGRVDRFRNEVPDITAFTYDDLRTALRVSDYPPGVRQWLAANAFHPLRLSDIRQAFFFGVIDKAEVIELYRDRGNILADARVAADLLEKQADAKIHKAATALAFSALKENLKHIIASFDTGLVTRQAAFVMLQAQGVEINSIDLILDNVLAKVQFKRFGIYLAKVKAGFMNGTYSSVQVRQYLGLLGVIPNRAAGYLQDWDLERTVSHKAASTAEILKYVREGLLSPTDGRIRLANLGWIDVDASLAIASAQAALARTQTRVLAAADRERARRARELQKVQEDLKKERKRIASQIRQETSLTTLKSWYVNCYIGRKYLIPRLTAMLYTADDIARYLHEWDDAREKKGNADCQPTGPEPGTNGSAPSPGVP